MKTVDRETPHLGFLSDGILTSEGIQKSLQAIEEALAGDTSSGLVVVAGQGGPLTDGNDEKISGGLDFTGPRDKNHKKEGESHRGYRRRGESGREYRERDDLLFHGGNRGEYIKEYVGDRVGEFDSFQGRDGLIRNHEADFNGRGGELTHRRYGDFSPHENSEAREHIINPEEGVSLRYGGQGVLRDKHIIENGRREGVRRGRFSYDESIVRDLEEMIVGNEKIIRQQGGKVGESRGGGRRNLNYNFPRVLTSGARSSTFDIQTVAAGVGGSQGENAPQSPHFRGQRRDKEGKGRRGQLIVIGEGRSQDVTRDNKGLNTEFVTESKRTLRPLGATYKVKEQGAPVTGGSGEGDIGGLIVPVGGEELDAATDEDFQKIIKSILSSDNVRGLERDKNNIFVLGEGLQRLRGGGKRKGVISVTKIGSGGLPFTAGNINARSEQGREEVADSRDERDSFKVLTSGGGGGGEIRILNSVFGDHLEGGGLEVSGIGKDFSLIKSGSSLSSGTGGGVDTDNINLYKNNEQGVSGLLAGGLYGNDGTVEVNNGNIEIFGDIGGQWSGLDGHTGLRGLHNSDSYGSFDTVNGRKRNNNLSPLRSISTLQRANPNIHETEGRREGGGNKREGSRHTSSFDLLGSLGLSHRLSKEPKGFTASLEHTGGAKSSVSINFGRPHSKDHRGVSQKLLNQTPFTTQGILSIPSNPTGNLHGLPDASTGGIQASPNSSDSQWLTRDTNYSVTVSDASSAAAASFLKSSLGDLSKYPPGVWRISR